MVFRGLDMGRQICAAILVPLMLAALCVSLNGQAAAAEAATADTHPDFHGVWWNEHPDKELRPLGGGAIPFTVAGKKLYAESAAVIQAAANKPVERNDMTRCLPSGPTRILMQPYPLQIVQKGDVVILIFEHNHQYVTVYFHETADPDKNSDPTYHGYAVGTWSKDAMTVKLTNFNDQTVLDDSGVPHSDKLVVTQKFEKANNGKTLVVTSTINDPVVFTKPWSVRHTFEYRPDVHIEEYVCGQGTLETRYTRQQKPND